MKDAIIVLAGGINNDGSLPDLPKKRVEKGVGLYNKKIAPKIIMTGKYGFWLDYTKEIPPRSEAEAMKEYAVSLGVPEEDIILEQTSKDTVGNAYFTKVDTLEKYDWKNTVVVTSKFHMPRTKFIFDTILGSGYKTEYISADDGVSQEDNDKAKAKEEKTTQVLKSLIKDIEPGNDEQVKNMLFTKHPGYSENPEISFEKLKEMLGR